jgi:DNA-binding NtrC family response regulator
MMANILIVDDQSWVRELLSEELISDGYRVAAAGDLQSARGQLRSSQPDLVILDLYLDGPEGKELLGDIKGENPDLPVIIFTAADGYVDDPRLSQADGYVIKSFVLDGLKRKVADVLEPKAGPQETVNGAFWQR